MNARAHGFVDLVYDIGSPCRRTPDDGIKTLGGSHALGRTNRKDDANHLLEKRLWDAADQVERSGTCSFRRHSSFWKSMITI